MPPRAILAFGDKKVSKLSFIEDLTFEAVKWTHRPPEYATLLRPGK